MAERSRSEHLLKSVAYTQRFKDNLCVFLCGYRVLYLFCFTSSYSQHMGCGQFKLRSHLSSEIYSQTNSPQSLGKEKKVSCKIRICLPCAIKQNYLTTLFFLKNWEKMRTIESHNPTSHTEGKLQTTPPTVPRAGVADFLALALRPLV